MNTHHKASLDFTIGGTSAARISLLAALATAIHVAESALPALGPIKPGFANAIVLATWQSHGLKAALMVNVLRLLCGALLSGALLSPRFGLALAGFAFSTIGLLLAPKLAARGVSLMGISVLCAWLHMAGQLLALGGVFPHFPLGTAAPWLLAYALVAGLATGWLALYFVRTPKEA